MSSFKYLKTFEKFNLINEFIKPLTYNMSGQHIWDMNDTILSLFFFKVREQHTTFDETGTFTDSFEVDKDLKNRIGLDTKELSEYIIGCSEGALIINSLVIEHYITGRETGRKNANKYQLEIAKKYTDSTIDELLPMVEDIITNIEKDEDRMKQNEIAIRLREKAKEEGVKKRAMKKQIALKDEELKRDLKKSKLDIGKVKSITDIDSVSIEVDTIIEHPKFGEGIVIKSDDKISTIDFKGDVKKMANKFISKFIK